VGIAHVPTTFDGWNEGSFKGTLTERHQRHRQKRRRRAKLRVYLKQWGVKCLPPRHTLKLARQVCQEFNWVVNALHRDHPNVQVAPDKLHVASTRFKALRMYACLHASHLAHIPA